MARRRERFEKELRSLHEGLSQPRRLKSYENVQRKVGRLVERYKQVASQYSVEVKPGSKGKAAAEDAGVGAYLLRTSHTEWDAEGFLRAYFLMSPHNAL